MSNLPSIAQLEFSAEAIAEDSNNRIHAALDWDFKKGDFRLIDGKTIRLYGLDYLKVWIRKALLTVKHTLIYKGSDFGSEHHSLIGKTFKPQFTKAEYERLIREALLINDAITDVTDFVFDQKGSRMTISFNVKSIYGEQTKEVTT